MSNQTRVFRWAPNWAVVLVVVLVAGLTAAGAKQLTEQLSGATPAQPAAATAPEAGSGSDPTRDSTRVPLPSPTGKAPEGELRTGPGEPPPAEVTVGPVVAGEESGSTPVADRVSVASGETAARAALSEALDVQASMDRSAGQGPPGSGEQEGSGPYRDALEDADLPLERAPDEFTMVAGVEPRGRYAEVVVGLGGALNGGLAALTIDFGDGSAPFALDEDRIEALGGRGQVSVTHAYQPTLTPQPQTATVVATDGAGGTHERIMRFQTRAAFRLSYSPLTVTALDDCDTFGKGDYELTWQNDRSLPAGKTSTFDLARGESYVERGFPTTVAPVHYGEFPQLFLVDGEPAFLYLSAREKDGPAGTFVEFVLGFPYEFEGPPGVPEFLTRGPVAQLGDHKYKVTVYSGGYCDVSMEFTAALTML